LSKDLKLRKNFLRNENEALLTSQDAIADEWVHYFDQLLNCRELINPFHFENREQNKRGIP